MPRLRLSDLPYPLLRLIRRTCFPSAMPRFLRPWLPGFRSNFSTHVVGLYDRHLAPKLTPAWPEGRTVLEIGVGPTNTSCYELAARGVARACAFEPFVTLDKSLDLELLAALAKHHGHSPAILAAKVERLVSTSALPDGSIDLILSNSVLEHVANLDALAGELRRLLASGGAMFHLVDYRDHFFRFPYHHLLWSQSVWSRFLDPGDLPRWRISDHVEAFQRHGLSVETVLASRLAGEFEKVRTRIHPHFSRYDETALATAFGALLIRHAEPSGS